MSAEKYTDYRQPNDDLLWSPSTNASNNYSLSSMGVDSPPEYSSSLPPINILGRETTFNNSRSLPSSIPMNELSINPSHITVPPPLDFDLGLRLTDDNGVTITCPRYEQQEENSLDEKELDDDDYADDFVEGDFDDDDDWGCAHAEHGTSAKRGQSAYSHPRAKSPTPMVDTDITKRSRGRRVPTQDNQRVFKCPDARCQKVFVRNEHLKRHIKSLHRDEKPFECLDAGCNKRFTRLDNRLSVENYLDDLKFDFDYPPKPLHRLDYTTSGCLMLGRTERAAKQFSSALANNKITKEYWGLVENMDRVYHDQGVVQDPISLSSTGRPYIGGDKKAFTKWQVLRYNPETCVGLCKFVIQTGRKHQIRLHASHVLGWPILGDRLYGQSKSTKSSSVVHLHARSVEFERFYKSRSGKAHKEQVKVEAPIPREWTKKMEESKFDDLMENAPSPWKTLDMRIPDQPTNGLFSQMQWDSGLYLCDMICDGRGPFHDLSNKRVLEFGAGTGLPSLLFALKGSPHVVCSDYDDHYLIDNLRRNVTANSVRNVDVVGHIWGQDVAPLIPDGRKFNLILCADTLWMSDQLENLLKSLTATIDKQDESSRVVIIAGFHTNRPHWQKNTA
ncbi:hypothetical protein E3P92_02993 [Wallemia ichthyophaga]|nr:hypothetical protein E3P92_02993 [Wallemia ichthyophaga]